MSVCVCVSVCVMTDGPGSASLMSMDGLKAGETLPGARTLEVGQSGLESRTLTCSVNKRLKHFYHPFYKGLRDVALSRNLS